MEKIDLLEEKIREAAKTIQQLREKNSKVVEQYKKLSQENELLHLENRQTGKLITEIDRLREERKLLKNKCEHLLREYEKMNL